MTKRQRRGWTNKTTLVGSVAQVYESKQVEESAETKSLTLKGQIRSLKQEIKGLEGQLIQLEQRKIKLVEDLTSLLKSQQVETDEKVTTTSHESEKEGSK